MYYFWSYRYSQFFRLHLLFTVMQSCIILIALPTIISAQSVAHLPQLDNTLDSTSSIQFSTPLDYASRRDFVRALRMAEQNRQQAPKNYLSHITLASVYVMGYNSGVQGFQDARKKAQILVEQALQMTDSSAVIDELANTMVQYPNTACTYWSNVWSPVVRLWIARICTVIVFYAC